ncbi:MAG: hypothetical protein BWY09_01942 [Candidatus Hydrogenedentes bacterium ADurb.Bin179]|nr:MAG: hypothetical protein BWY09_01942 [Candidatus Hydrogenedentes bacterium ADurb.Bin179]
MARFCGGDGRLKGLCVAHFTDQNDIGVFTHDGTQGNRKVLRIERDLSLGNNGFFIGVQVFDGVFECYNMKAFARVNPVYNRGECGGFAAAGGTRNEDQASGHIGNSGHDRRQIQGFEIQDDALDMAHDKAGGATLAEHVYTESADARHPVRQVGVAFIHKGIELFIGHQFPGVPQGIFGGKRFPLQEAHFAVDTQHGGTAHGKMQVRRTVFDGIAQQFVYLVLFLGDVHERILYIVPVAAGTALFMPMSARLPAS